MKTDISVYRKVLENEPFPIFLHNIQMGFNAIPEEYRKDSKVIIEHYSEYPSMMHIVYTRPLTPEEIEANAAHEKRIADVYKEKRRAMLDELKKEFGDE